MYKVFLVDDEQLALEQAANSIPWVENGFVVSGEECDPICALERIVRERPHVVFTDLRMPMMSGLELMQQTKERGYVPEFVILSAYSDYDDVRGSFMEGGFDYITKPFQQNEMELLLNRLWRKLASQPLPPHAENKPEDIIPLSSKEGLERDLTFPESFDAMLDYLTTHFSEHHTLSSLSRKFGLSDSYICHHFSERYNTSLISFLTSLRMEEAKRLILTEGEPLKKIALTVGYSDYFYFSKVFKNYFGVSPSKFSEDSP